MPNYTDEELERLLASGEAAQHEDGSITWAPDNTLDKKPGTWLVRPPQAAPLITSETGQELAILRMEKRRKALEDGFAEGVTQAVNDALGEDGNKILTTDEALMALASVAGQAAMNPGRKDFARLLQLWLEALQALPQKKIEIDQRKQTIDMSKSSIKILGNSPAISRLLADDDGID